MSLVVSLSAKNGSTSPLGSGAEFIFAGGCTPVKEPTPDRAGILQPKETEVGNFLFFGHRIRIPTASKRQNCLNTFPGEDWMTRTKKGKVEYDFCKMFMDIDSDAFFVNFLELSRKNFAIIGNPLVCSASTQTYSVALVPTATSYSWALPGGWSGSSVSNVISATVGASGSVTVTALNAGGIVSTQTLDVQVDPAPIIAVNGATICSGQSFTINPTGALSYTITGGSNVVSPFATTDYSVTGTNANGCISSNTAVCSLTVLPSPVISVRNGAICDGQTFTMSPNGAITYTFSSGNAVVSPTATTSYFITGTDAEGCIGSNTAICTVIVNPLPIISVNSGSICVGENYTISPTGAATYTFSGGSAVVSPVVTTDYSVSGTSAAGCLSSNTAVCTVTVHSLPIIGINSGSICIGQNFTLVPTGAYTYTVSNGTTLVNPTITTTYSVTGTSTAGCLGVEVFATVTVNLLPVISANSGSICYGDSFTISPTGANTYTFSGGNAIVSPTILSNYSITGMSAEGCVSSNTAISTVTVNALPLITVNSGSICSGDNFTLSPSGAITYTFSGGNSVINPITTTNYTVAGTDALGCVGQAITSVQVVDLPSVSLNSESICYGQSFTLSPTGADTYTFSSGSSVVMPTVTTSYSIVGTSSVGCLSSEVICTITVNDLPVISINGGSICVGQSFTLNPEGANTYTFSGDNAVVSPTLSTNYSVTGTSSAGCISSNTAICTVTVNIRPLIAVNSGSICTGQSFTISPSGADTYTFSSGSPVVSPSVTAIYSVTGTSQEGCESALASVCEVTVHDLPVITASGATVCLGKSASLVANGGIPNGYMWLGPHGYVSTGHNAFIQIVNTLSNGDYTVVGTSTNSCKASTSVNLSFYNLPIPTYTVPTRACFQSAINLLSAAAVSYTWTVASGNKIFTQNAITIVTNSAGVENYSLTIMDDRGCLNTATMTVYVDLLPSGALLSGRNVNKCIPFCNTYTLFADDNPAPITNITWDINGQLYSGSSFNYCLMDLRNNKVVGSYTNALGCVNKTTYEISGYPVPKADFEYQPFVPVENVDEVTFVNTTQGDRITQWSWSIKPTDFISYDEQPSYLFENAGYYTVRLVTSNGWGCNDTVIKTLMVEEDFRLYIPNAFTPNDDGINDTFSPKGGGVKNYSLVIYDRWGNKIFTTTEFGKAWDGYKNGEIMPQGVYVWEINIVSTNGKTKEMTGYVSLIR